MPDEFEKAADLASKRGQYDLATRILLERCIVFRLIDLALEQAGNTISVFDGEEWTVKKSRDKKAIRNALFTTDDDQIRIRDGNDNKIGWFHLIYGNYGWDVISDYSANNYSDGLWKQIEPMTDKLEITVT